MCDADIPCKSHIVSTSCYLNTHFATSNMVAVEMEAPSLHIRLKAATPAHLRAAHNVELSVPQTTGRNALRKLLYHLLSLPETSRPDFHFLAGEEPLRTTFDRFLQRRNLSAETTIDVTYYLSLPEPEEEPPIAASNEWVSCINVYKGEKDPVVVAGSYSGAPCVYRGTEAVVPETASLDVRHAAPIKSVAWLRDGNHFITAGQDQCARLWRVDEAAAKAVPFAIFRTEDSGDPVGLTAVAVDKLDIERVALGAEDGSLWVLPELPISQPVPVIDEDGKRKKADIAAIPAVRVGSSPTPLPITALTWREQNALSVGWDALVRIWDVNACSTTVAIPCGGKPVTSMSVTNQSILIAAIDGAVRLVDARDGKGVIAACSRKGAHNGIASAIHWLDADRNCVSGGVDGSIQFWDVRSMMSPVRSIADVHDGKPCMGLGCVKVDSTWHIFSGGADGKVARIHI